MATDGKPKPEGAIELPEGEWAVLYSPRRVPERRKRLVLEAMASLSDTVVQAAMNAAQEQMTADEAEGVLTRMSLSGPDLVPMMDVFDAGVVALVKEWSYGEDITRDALLDLPSEDCDMLREACAPFIEDLSVGFKPQVDATRSSPTTPSGE